jgi:hypothetical protein
MTARQWQPVDLAAIVDAIRTGEAIGPVPTLMLRSDGQPLLYPGQSHGISAPPEAGKTWLALTPAASLLKAGKHVLFMDCETTAVEIVGRLQALGATDDQIVAGLTYVRPEIPPDARTISSLLESGPFELAIIDGVSEAFTLCGLDPNSNTDAAKFFALLVRPITDTGAAVVLLDHVVKQPENRGRYALGAGHKLAAVAVAYTIDVLAPPSRRTTGKLKIRVVKDRHGHIRGYAVGDTIAIAHITPANDGEQVTVTVDPPDAETTAGDFRPTVLMERVSEYVAAHPGASQRAIRDGVKGKNSYVIDALGLLIAEHYLEARDEGRTHTHHPIRPYIADHHGSTVPERFPTVPGTTTDDRFPGSHPLGEPEPGTTNGHAPLSTTVDTLIPSDLAALPANRYAQETTG